MDAKTKRIWAGLVSYANGTATDREVWSTVVDYMGWISTYEALFGAFGWIGHKTLPEQVAEYRPAVDVLLRFLCSPPKSEDRKSLRSSGAMSFLYKHGEHIRGISLTDVPHKEELQKSLQNSNYTATELESLKEHSQMIWDNARYGLRRQTTIVGTDLLPLGLRVPTKGYEDLADPICDFLMSEYQAYLNRPYSRHKKASPIVPIFVCPSCNKLVMPERTGRKQYCSDCTDRARAEKYRQKAPANERKDYQWLYRLRHKEPTLRKMFFHSQKNQVRLKEIKSRQRESSRCQGLIRGMHL